MSSVLHDWVQSARVRIKEVYQVKLKFQEALWIVNELMWCFIISLIALKFNSINEDKGTFCE